MAFDLAFYSNLQTAQQALSSCTMVRKLDVQTEVGAVTINVEVHGVDEEDLNAVVAILPNDDNMHIDSNENARGNMVISATYLAG
jgi:hypothetical protein